jgi:hypothetical protein
MKTWFKIPNYSKQFLYHIHLEAGKQFSIITEGGWNTPHFFFAECSDQR